ncbi:MAG: PAS domain-containing sensor histidine kinase [Ignavibacteriae bacterium]|nr:PAS domain-containing sensor histidine kinase [Ignavibacteriota bacterium]
MKKVAKEITKDFAVLTEKYYTLEKQNKKIRKSLKEFEDIFHNYNDSIFIINEFGKILKTNQTAQTLYNYTSKEILSKSIFEICSELERIKITELLNQPLIETLNSWESEHKTKNGNVLKVKVHVKKIKFENQNCIMIIVHDVSESDNYNNVLENQKDLFMALMNNITDRIYFKDVNSKFILINKEMISNLQLTNADDAIGKCDHDFFDKKHADQALSDEKKVIRTKRAIISKFEKERVQNTNKDYQWVNTTKVPIINKNGKVTGIVGISRNVTAIKNAENKVLKYAKELQYINAAKDKFFSILAHDLKNPFFSLLGYVELIQKNYNELSDSEKVELLNNISSISKNSYQLLENLLQWASTQSGRIEYRPKEIDLKNYVEYIVEFFTPIAQKKNIVIVNNITNSCKAYADSDMIRTVLRNLITNAIKFTPQDGKVSIDSLDKNNFFKITVSDSGCGLDKEHLNNLFRIDMNHKSTGTCNEEGTGLGLIICKEFIERNGGRISVKSKLGKGSMFSFTVPKQI